MKRITFSTPPDWVGNEYSSMSPFNCDNSLLLLIKVNHFGLYDGDGKFLYDLPIGASQQPRWSRGGAHLLYFIDDRQLKMMDVAVLPPQIALIHDFDKYVSIDGKGESDISADGDHFVFFGSRQDGTGEVIVFRVNGGGSIVETHPIAQPFDGLKITAQNHAILSRTSNPRDPEFDGIWDLTTGLRLTNYNGHACPTSYEGRDKLLWCSSEDPTVNADDIIMIDVETGARRVLWNVGWEYAFHISACKGDFCIVSTDDPDRLVLSQVWKVPYDGTAPTLICDTGSIYDGYGSQVKAALSWDGSKLVGCSDFGDTSDLNACDVFMVKLMDSPNLPETPDKYGEIWLTMGVLPFNEVGGFVSYDSASKSVMVHQLGSIVGSLPFDDASDLLYFSSRDKNVTIYRRK